MKGKFWKNYVRKMAVGNYFIEDKPRDWGSLNPKNVVWTVKTGMEYSSTAKHSGRPKS